MNILILIPELPYPRYLNGISSTVSNLIEKWQIEHNIDLIYFSEKNIDTENKLTSEYKINIDNDCIVGKEIFINMRNRNVIKARNSWGYKFSSAQKIDVSGYDLVLVSSFVAAFLMGKIVNRRDDTRIVFFEADAMSLYYRRSMDRTKSIIKKIYLYIQSIIVHKNEELFYDISNEVVFVSDVDLNYAEQNFNNMTHKLRCINIGVETSASKDKTFYKKDKVLNICFSGLMNYKPNIEAVEYLLEKIVPELEKMEIEYLVHIVGKSPQREWYENEMVKNGRVVITGFLEDIDAYLVKMDVYMSPLFLGTGMKNKILQAMALGLPVICSETSIEGINQLVDGTNVLVCSEHESDWVEALEKLILDEEMMNYFITENKKIIEKDYSWEKTANTFLIQ